MSQPVKPGLSLVDCGRRQLLKEKSFGSEQPVVSLLAPTGLDFLIAWVACMGLGYGVTFIA